MLKYLVDTHCHSVATGHAYSTIQELAEQASKKNMEMIAITDHGVAMVDAPHYWHFGNMKILPSEIYGVKILKGVEANIIDMEGNLDMPEEYLCRLDWVIASFHDVCIEPGTVEQHTHAWIKVIENKYVDAIGHSGNPVFTYHYDEVLRCVKDNDKLVEINNHSFSSRPGSEENCKLIAQKCKEMGVKVVVGSDAHISFDVGKFDKVYEIFKEVNMPEELVMNTSAQKLLDYLRKRKNISI
ncbi:phosphatase [Petroclostridium sp. X23]|uniref:phosphatase n=1 Tax=Petroclostridium sp. X23 TaxID=3045146 RepID=UPI0024AD5C69|nr:phosphatase [Petroclostridium sp. X23]WHH60477.1 phosphatase [Petroclostridium sp. X23]